MKRRDLLRKLLFTAASATSVVSKANAVHSNIASEDFPNHKNNVFESRWHLYNDMTWTGDDLWAQRLQDWRVSNGNLVCDHQGVDRTVTVLTHQLSDVKKAFTLQYSFSFLSITDNAANAAKSYSGVRLGIKGRYQDYRSAIFTGKGYTIGLTKDGYLFIGNKKATTPIAANWLNSKLKLHIQVTPPKTGGYFVKVKLMNEGSETIATINAEEIDETLFTGNIAMVSHFDTEKNKTEQPALAIHSLKVEGEKLAYQANQTYGAIYFAQYTVHNQQLKLTAQLAPIDTAAVKVLLYYKQKNEWQLLDRAIVHPLARTAQFTIPNWNTKLAAEYKLVYRMTTKTTKPIEYTYQGTIAAEPLQKENVKALAFSCNWDYGFPDNEVVSHANLHKADMVFFLGDQFYESNGGFGVQTNNLEKATLDYLRKWYMFGWSYRDLFRHIPMVALPDDHDVYHGNIWGAGGRPTTPKLAGANAQDSGGYKMPAEWVNMAQITQTSHMPTPTDNAKALQGINVYFTNWQYGGINCAIIEDRKFKSPPKDILPTEANVFNGFVKNGNYDHSAEKTLEAQLIGERQINFLKKWKNDFSNKNSFNILVSATPFCCLQTLPKDIKNDNSNPDLPIPNKGEYVYGDVPAKDMDSNGWPHNRRDEVVALLGKEVNLHLCGDQHLPSVVQYGTQNFEDGTHCFAVPALNNIWPRRWWPGADLKKQIIPDQPAHLGNFEDGFNNKITVKAVANPHKTGIEPAILHDRVTGYGLVDFNKKTKTIQLHCFPRYAVATNLNNEQFNGWPLIIT